MQYQPRKVVKAQALVDFFVEATKPPQGETKESPIWKLWVDGSSAETGGGTGALLEDLMGTRLQYVVSFRFPVSNNIVEYKDLVVWLRFAA